MKELDLEKCCLTRISALSGGERKRVSLATEVGTDSLRTIITTAVLMRSVSNTVQLVYWVTQTTRPAFNVFRAKFCSKITFKNTSQGCFCGLGAVFWEVKKREGG